MISRPAPNRPHHPQANARRRAVRPVAVAALVLAPLAAGCSFSVGGSPRSAAESAIEGDLAEDGGLGEVEATCDEPASDEVGEEFTCTSTSDLGPLRWRVTIGEDDKVDVQSVNLVTAEGLDLLETEAVRLLEEQIGSEIGRDNLECGDGPIALDEDSSVLCAITDPASGDVYDATLTVSDTTTGEFDIVVADEPR